MKKIYTKKLVAVVLAATLVVSMAGCGKKTVDYDIDGDGSGSASSDGGELASKLGIPESYEGELSVGSSGLTKIEIDDNDISVPSADSMSIITYELNTFDSEYKQQVCEAIFDKSAGIYVYDWENMTVEDIESQLATYESLLASAQADGDEDTEEYCQDYIDYLNSEMENAVTEREAAGDYSDSDFIGTIGSSQFLLSFSDSEDSLGAYFELSYYPSENLIDYKPYDGATYVYAYDAIYGDDGYDDSITNSCSFDEDEAVTLAEEFLAECGIEDVMVTNTSALLWEYYDTSYDIVATEYDGYIITLARSVNGTAPYTGDLSMIDTLADADTWYDVSVETFEIQVDSNGVINAICYPLLNPTGEEETNVDLLTWDEILEVLDSNIGNYFAENETSYSTVEFNDVRLTYYLMIDEDDDSLYKYVPVWVFAEADEYDGEYDYDYPIQAVVINATDGTFYDINTLLSIGDAWSYEELEELYSDYLTEEDDEDDEDEYVIELDDDEDDDYSITDDDDDDDDDELLLELDDDDEDDE